MRENRLLYAQKYRLALPLVREPLQTYMPDGGFYLWMRTPLDDSEFARELQRQYNVLVLPGSYLARDAHGVNPRRNFVRIALVAPQAECFEAIQRIDRFSRQL